MDFQLGKISDKFFLSVILKVKLNFNYHREGWEPILCVKFFFNPDTIVPNRMKYDILQKKS